MRKKQKEYTADLPPDEFNEWWYPTGTDELSGASIGGHPDSERTWSRRDGSFWKRRRYGINAMAAWSCDRYREEFEHWQNNGSPPRAQEFVSNAATLPRQKEFWLSIKALLAKAAPKKMPKPLPLDYDKSRGRVDDDDTVDAEFKKLDDNQPF